MLILFIEIESLFPHRITFSLLGNELIFWRGMLLKLILISLLKDDRMDYMD